MAYITFLQRVDLFKTLSLEEFNARTSAKTKPAAASTTKPASKATTPNPFTREYVASVYAARKAGTPSAPRA
mgnify:CR=1 FL=1